ncbi:DNA-protecting protein DprA [Acetobacter tropicalis]|uniref:Rossmann fold nucleotide-binding protein Smf possibly involved in DNA uptake n=1 Tax=Acetobacter tropicalis TaxID=104102 RepID=A0A094YPI8_9PROT|nr:DNA-processing protein DprA [Acetobacter tropicalis]KAA8391153.1 DNA-protecting protein DprA [Acetobacter tropicalis]KAA8392256.1 DNA-protecting protein DprA [Acetobacter tropicalis]KGB23990.1 Rossmann fold nucleotide-binding protein Smf possibly involved in DNA uptake [Acetobacter tropicalis]MBC9009322.1 DNA-protecting protein DprA [Acetobacter tropicalis]MDO8170635.1 DNA-processing protein DprA [Acetobacter tropicalis]
MTSLAACLRLARTDSVGPRTWRRLVERYQTPEAALDALPHLPARNGRTQLIPPSPAHIEAEIDATLKIGGQFLTLLDATYSPLLRACPDAPPVISVLGDASCLNKPGVGLVGARNASAHGVRLAESLATELAEAGLVVISGLARGIDRAAHMGALHRHGLTIAAIAGGLDCPYPRENAALHAEIAEKGVLVTEAPLGTTPTARHFPRRNRLIAGLGLGCVVVEAASHSGTLITARLVVDYGRELFAVPGSPLDSRCRGSNNLLRQGAILTESVADILPNLPAIPACPEKNPPLFPTQPDPVQEGSVKKGSTAQKQNKSAIQSAFSLPLPAPAERSGGAPVSPENVREKVLDLLSFTPIPVDDLVRHCQFSASTVLTVLTELELSGCVDSLPGGRIVLAAPHGKDG